MPRGYLAAAAAVAVTLVFASTMQAHAGEGYDEAVTDGLAHDHSGGDEQSFSSEPSAKPPDNALQEETSDEEPSSKEDDSPDDLRDHELVRDDDGTVEPGALTPAGDVMIGLNPQAFAVDDSLDIRVQSFEPEETSTPPSDSDAVDEVGPFYEISSPKPRLWGPQPGLLVVLPVPDDVDTNRIAAMTRSYTGTEPDGWTKTMEDGTYVEKQRVFVVELSQLGAHRQPTQLGVVERSDTSTDSGETFDDVVPSQFNTD